MAVDLKLSANPDGYGFHYGTVDVDGRVHRVNVLPPIALWKGDMKLPNYEPHEADWIVFVNGDEIARVRRREELGERIEQRLLGCKR